MAVKDAFENNYEKFTEETAKYILNDSYTGLSEKFQRKLEKFNDLKIKQLAKMEKEIYCNGTVYTGSAGLALHYLMLGLRKNDPQLLMTALNYINVDNLSGNNISFLRGDAGPLAIATIISYKLGNHGLENLPDYKILASRLIYLSSALKNSPNDILYGKAGYLYAMLFVNKHVGNNTNNGKELIPAKFIQEVIDSILKSGQQYSELTESESPLLWQSEDEVKLGAAYGMAGILYMLLQASQYMSPYDLQTYVKPSIDWLLKQGYPNGNFPPTASRSDDKLVQWCHGAPGFVALCILAAETFPSFNDKEKYMKIATKACDVTWERGICTKGYSLCHGVSGNAYAFLQMYHHTKEPIYLYRACCFMEWCAEEHPGTECYHPDRPASLFEGLVGPLYLAADLQHVSDAKFPGYTV